jgi:transposase-like protein
MSEITRLNDCNDTFALDFVEREATPKDAMKLAVRLHLSGLSLSNTVSVLDVLGINRARSTIHNWVQKADLEPDSGRNPDTIALDETVVKVNGERFWLYAAVEPETNVILHVSLYSTRTIVTTKLFLRDLAEKHEVDDAEFLVDGTPWLQARLFELAMHFRHETFGVRNPVERIFQETKRRTEQFYNTFSHASPESAENWLLALSWAQNRLI